MKDEFISVVSNFFLFVALISVSFRISFQGILWAKYTFLTYGEHFFMTLFLIFSHSACKQFNFNPMILRWWKKQGIKRYDSLECLEMTAAVGANFVVTNCSAVNHLFDCHPAWCACWPCYLLFAVPYKIWRNAIQGIRDISVTMENDAISGSLGSSNYNLADLHQSPVYSNQPISSAQEVVPNSIPLAHGMPSYTFFPPPSLQGTLDNPRFKAN